MPTHDTIEAHVERRYRVLRHIGGGAYGIVWKAVDRETSTVVALKKVFDAFSNATDAQRTYREVALLMHLRHPNIVRLVDVMRSANGVDLYVAFELSEADLHAVIRSGVMMDVHRIYVTYQVTRCVRFLHRCGVIHRDLKPANVLLSSSSAVQVADFGLARTLKSLRAPRRRSERVLTDYIATRWYRAPEIVMGSQAYSPAVDVWAIGCIVGEMFTGRPLLAGTSTLHQLQLIVSALGMPSEDAWAAVGAETMEHELVVALHAEAPPTPRPLAKLLQEKGSVPREALDFVARAMVFDPTRRMTAEEAMRHPFVAPFASEAHDEEDEELAARFRRPDEEGGIPMAIDDDTREEVDSYRNNVFDTMVQIFEKRRALDVLMHTRKSLSPLQPM